MVWVDWFGLFVCFVDRLDVNEESLDDGVEGVESYLPFGISFVFGTKFSSKRNGRKEEGISKLMKIYFYCLDEEQQQYRDSPTRGSNVNEAREGKKKIDHDCRFIGWRLRRSEKKGEDIVIVWRYILQDLFRWIVQGWYRLFFEANENSSCSRNTDKTKLK